MMKTLKLWILSDLHLEFEQLSTVVETFKWDIPDFDILVLAGDIATGFEAQAVIETLLQERKPIIYVMGNHEFYTDHPQFQSLRSYKKGIEEIIDYWQTLSQQHPNLHVLEKDSVIIEGIQFVGTCLWSDHLQGGLVKHPVSLSMNDYQLSLYQGVRFSPQKACELHAQSKQYLQQTLRQASLPCIVITHFAPSFAAHHTMPMTAESNHWHKQIGANTDLKGLYASDLDDLILASSPLLWIHGHIHQSLDYKVGATRLVCNPRGYCHNRAKLNRAFSATQVITIDVPAHFQT